MTVNDLQPKNAELLIYVHSGKFASVKEEQFTKALCPIFSQIGKLMLAKE